MKQQLVLRTLAKTKELVNGRPIIDRNKVSTNNLRRLVLSANGLLQEHYVTGKGYNHLLDFKAFGDKELEGIYKDFENKRLNVADYKPMIDAVYKHHIYNNLEEILLLKSDYMHLGLHDEFELEKYGLDKFTKTYNLLKKSFARLSHISIAELDMVTLQQLYNDRKIVKDKPISEQLKTLGYKVDLIVREIERLPNGNPAVFVRNTDKEKGYAIDEEYTGGEVKETQRLHKWFLDSQKVVEVTEVEEKQAEVEVDEVAINLNLSKIMKVYRDLYLSCFGLKKPVGLLVPEGILSVSNGLTVVKKSKEYSKIYDLAVSSSKHSVVVEGNLENISVDDLYKQPLNGTYFPLFHLAVMSGRSLNYKFKSWDIKEKISSNVKEIETTLENEISKLVKSKLIEVYKKGENLNEITDKLCTVFLITELAQSGDKSLLMLKFKFSAGNAKFDLNRFCTSFSNGGDKYLAGGAKITQRKVKPTGVSQINLCLNEDLYQSMPLFAYDAVNHKKSRGQKISIRNCILGQTVDDEILTINLTKNDAKVINILAGPRAGKGVLTLGLLGTILSDGCPLIYMDAKPDMANVLNEVANANGLRVAAWDLNTPPIEYLKANPIMVSLAEAKIQAIQSLGQNAPSELAESTSDSTWGLLAYLKILQLTMVSAKLQKDKKITTPGAGQAFFVLDELLRVYSELEVFYNILSNIVKDKNTDPQLLNWCNKLLKWINNLGQDFQGSMVAEMPNSNTSVFCLYQKAATWKYDKKPSPTQAVFTPLTTASNATKLVGGANATAEGLDSLYALQQQNRELASKVTEYRHFGMFTGSKLNDADSCTVFKSYLVLNSADMDSQYVQDMRANIGEKAFEDLVVKGGGTVPKGVGFEGFMETIGPEGISNLSRGYEYLNQILEVSGLSKKYNSIEEYLYDSDIDSFYSKNILVEGRAGEVLVVKAETNTQSNSSGIWNMDGVADMDAEDVVYDDLEPIPTNDVSNPQPPIQPARPMQQPNTQPIRTNQQSRPVQQVIESPPITITADNTPYPTNLGSDIKSFGVVSKYETTKKMTEFLKQSLIEIYGGLENIKSFKITQQGYLFVNNRQYIPNFIFEEGTVPVGIKMDLDNAIMSNAFNYNIIKDFENLEEFVVEDNHQKNRVRTEVNLRKFGSKDFVKYFRYFKNLMYLRVGDVEYNRDNLTKKSTDNNGPLGFGRPIRQSQPIQLPANDYLSGIWQSRPVKMLTSAFGYTLGVNVFMSLAPLFGPWSMVFAVMYGAQLYNQYKSNQPQQNATQNRNQNNQMQNTQNRPRRQNTQNSQKQQKNGNNRSQNNRK